MPKKINIFQIISLLLATITIIFASYYLVHPDSIEISLNYAQFFLGCTVFFSSLSSFKEKQKVRGTVSLLVSLFVLSVFTWTLIQYT